MTYQQTENDLLVGSLMERVEAIDPKLALELSNAHCQALVEAENRANPSPGPRDPCCDRGRPRRMAGIQARLEA
jgi:hypothetical protein